MAGQPTQFDVVYTLVASTPTLLAASYSLSDSPGLDSNASIVSTTYTLNGGAAVTLSGSGPWSLQPQWRALAGGATDTYLLTVRISVNRGGTTANDACAAPTVPGSGLHNSVCAVLQGVVANTTFEASACRNTPTPVWVTLRKQLAGRAITTDQVQVRMLAAGIPMASATTSGSTAPATASTGLQVMPAHKKRSASFFLPDSPGNPTPGKMHLRHVGWLGAAAPAVKGLRDVGFSGGTEG